MSYPGYPPYPQAHKPHPQGGAQYPPNTYPPGQPDYPNLGFRFDAPVYMPSRSYSNQSSPYHSSGYPTNTPYPGGVSSHTNSSNWTQYPTTTTYPFGGSAPYPRQPSHAAAQPLPSHNMTTKYPTSSYLPSASYSNAYSHNVGYGVEQRKTPTVVPAHPFDAQSDAQKLRKAMKGFGTDEKTIISVLTKRSNAQRLQIALEFKTLYGKDLVKDLKSETSGKFEDLLVALMTPLPQFYAKELHDAISGLGTDEDVLIEVLCTKSNNEIRTIRVAYQSMYGRTLEQDLKGDTSGTFKRLMVSLCNACRDESMVTNPSAAAEDARQLLRAGELRLGTDESTFNMVLCQRNYAQLRLIFDEYYKVTGHDFEKAINNEFSGNSRDGLLAIVQSIRNQPVFFAKCLHNAIAGFGTNDRKLIRVIVTRCEIDMGEIKTNYMAQYGETLADAIKGDTSGDYKKCLLALIGES